MLDETSWTQGAGMLMNASAKPLRILPVLPSGEAADTEALWHACALLQRQGYPVIVLDGTEQETPEAPGLEDLLHPGSGLGHCALPVDGQPHSIASLPAARGMVQLVHKAGSQGVLPLEMLYRHVRNHAVVVLLASAPLMAMLLQGCSRAPVQLVHSQQRHMAEGYRALKHIFMHTGLMPHLVALRPQATGLDPVLKALAQSALEHLHTEPLAEQLDPAQPRQLQRWALQCLEQCEAIYPPEAQPTLAGIAAGQGGMVSPATVAAAAATAGSGGRTFGQAARAAWSH